MDQANLPPVADRLLKRLRVGLWTIAASQIEVGIAAELADVQRELLEQATTYRETGSELGNALAVRLEAAAARITAALADADDVLQGSTDVASRRRPARDKTSLPSPDGEMKRSRGRPRKSTPVAAQAARDEAPVDLIPVPREEAVS
jgi:hypothetical protein